MRFVLLFLLVAFPASGFTADHTLKIELLGVNHQQKERIFANLSLKTLQSEKKMNAEDIRSLHQLALVEIKTTLETLGYYHPKLTSELIQQKEGFVAKYNITLGPAVLIQKVILNLLGMGENDLELKKIIQKSPLKAGEKLDHKLYETFKEELLERALDLGYLDSRYDLNEIRLDLSKNQAEIFLILDTEKRYKIGKVRFNKSPYPVEYLKRYIPFSIGTPYTTEKIVDFQRALVNSGLFNKVLVEPKVSETKNLRVPLNVKLISKPHNKYTASVGFGTDTGPRGSLGWERRRAAYPGHRINISTKVSNRVKQANAQYSVPGENPITDRLVFGTQVVEEKPSDKKYSLRNESTISRLQMKEPVEEILALQYLSETFRDVPTDPKKHSHFLLPSIGCTWNNIGDEKKLLQTGMRFSVNLKGGVQFLLSSSDLIQVENRVKWILPLGEMSRMILRGTIGATGTSNINELPLSLRFFAGGDYSVRGYGYQSLGPKKLDANGNEIVIGGRYLLLGSVELERRIYKKIGAAVFLDSGNAMNKWKTKLYNGVGFGIRYETPLGPLRLDIARPLLRGKHRPRIHFTFGVDL